jgi:polysaccharide biosynthesis protein PslG
VAISGICETGPVDLGYGSRAGKDADQTRYVGNMGRRNRSAVGLGVATVAATLLALAVQTGGAAGSSAAPADGSSATRAITTTSGTSVTRRFFGLHAPLLGTRFPDAPAGAVDLTTNGVYWPNLEKPTGEFDFTRLEAILDKTEPHHATSLLVLGGTPSFHSTDPTSAPVAATVPEMDAWKNYVRHVVTQYGSEFEYQIWPEPNVPNNFAGTPQQLARLVAAASKIIHRIAPAATVVAPAMVVRLQFERIFMRSFFAARVGGFPLGHYVDAVGIDPYPKQAGTPEDALALVAKAQHILAVDHVTAPLWTLEVNYFVPVGGVTDAEPPSDRTSTSYVVRTYVLSAAAGVQRVYWLGWLRYFNLGISMVEPDGVTPTASGLAFSRVRGWLLGQHARGCTVDDATGVYACRFVRAGLTSWVYWVQSGRTQVSAPAGVRHRQTMYGVTSPLRAGDRIRVTNAPVWVYH